MRDKEPEEEAIAPAVPVGERWLKRARQLTQRRLPMSTRLRFVAAVRNRHHTANPRLSLMELVRERQRAATPGPTAASLPWLQPMQGAWPTAPPTTLAPVSPGPWAPGAPAARVIQDRQHQPSPPPQAGQVPLRPLPTVQGGLPQPPAPASDATPVAGQVPLRPLPTVQGGLPQPPAPASDATPVAGQVPLRPLPTVQGGLPQPPAPASDATPVAGQVPLRPLPTVQGGLPQPPAPASDATPVARQVPLRPLPTVQGGLPQPPAPASDATPVAGQVPLRPLPTVQGGLPQPPALPPSPTSDTTTEAARLPASVAQSPPLRLEARAQKVLASALGMRIPAVNIYANPAADQVARQHRADAVTYGNHILFRAGKYDPTTPQGLGLLGHELTHVAQARQQSVEPAMPLAPYTVAQEEALALRNEQQVLNRLANYRTAPLAPPPYVPPPSSGVGHVPPVPGAPGAPPAPRPAVTERPLNGAGPSNASAAAPALTAAQLQQIKDMVYRDLLDRIREEFEGGA